MKCSPQLLELLRSAPAQLNGNNATPIQLSKGDL